MAATSSCSLVRPSLAKYARALAERCAEIPKFVDVEVETPTGKFTIKCVRKIYVLLTTALQIVNDALKDALLFTVCSSKLLSKTPEGAPRWETTPEVHCRGSPIPALLDLVPEETDVFATFADIDIFCNFLAHRRMTVRTPTVQKTEKEDMCKFLTRHLMTLNFAPFLPAGVEFECDSVINPYTPFHLCFNLKMDGRVHKVDVTFDIGISREVPFKYDVRLMPNGTIKTNAAGLLSLGKFMCGEPQVVPPYLEECHVNDPNLWVTERMGVQRGHYRRVARAYRRVVNQLLKGGYGRGGLERFSKPEGWVCPTHLPEQNEASVSDLVAWRVTPLCCAGEMCCMCVVETLRSNKNCPCCRQPIKIAEPFVEDTSDCIEIARRLFLPSKISVQTRFRRAVPQKLPSGCDAINTKLKVAPPPAMASTRMRYELEQLCSNTDNIVVTVNSSSRPVNLSSGTDKFIVDVDPSAITEIMDAISGIIAMLFEAAERAHTMAFYVSGMPIQHMLYAASQSSEQELFLACTLEIAPTRMCFAVPFVVNETQFMGESDVFCGSAWTFKKNNFLVHFLKDFRTTNFMACAMLYSASPIQCIMHCSANATPNSTFTSIGLSLSMTPHGAHTLLALLNDKVPDTISPYFADAIENSLLQASVVEATRIFAELLAQSSFVANKQLVRAGSADADGVPRFCLGCGGDETTLPDVASTDIDDQLRWKLVCLECKCEGNHRWHCMWCVLNYLKLAQSVHPPTSMNCPWCRSRCMFVQNTDYLEQFNDNIVQMESFFRQHIEAPRRLVVRTRRQRNSEIAGITNILWHVTQLPVAAVAPAAPLDSPDPFDPAIVSDVGAALQDPEEELVDTDDD